jgi:DNA-binding transcriptional LysR family regulator
VATQRLSLLAARKVHVTQPALTRSISNLEDELGVQLFERSKSGMLPTEFATRIAPRFQELLLELDDIGREARLYRDLESGRLNIGLGQAIREPLARSCVPRFVERFPGIALKVQEGTAPELARALERRKIDMIIAGVASYDEYKFTRSEPIMEIPTRVMVREGHPLAKRKSVEFRDLLEFPQAAPTTLGPRHPFRARADLEQGGAFTPHVLCSDYEVLRSIAAASDAWIPSLDSELHRVAHGSLCELNVVDLDITIDLGVIELKRRSRSPAASHFVETVRSILAGE